MKQLSSAALVSAVTLAPLSGGAQAQIDSPSPALKGQPSFHLYTVPGVTSHAITRTFFRCTNTTSESIRVRVEVFDFGGDLRNDASATSMEFPPSGSLGFATDTAFAIDYQSVLGVGNVPVGSARILATKPKGIVCTAFLGNPINNPPAFMAHLNAIKKMDQKGD